MGGFVVAKDGLASDDDAGSAKASEAPDVERARSLQ
jgi:hypothetical protein